MNKKIRSFFKQLSAKRVKPIAMTLLILLGLITSCTVRKGIQSFLLGNVTEYNLATKPGKNLANRNATVIDCSIKDQSLVDLPSVSKQANTQIVILFSPLPTFLLSSIQTLKDHPELPVPYAKLRWSCLPLFLQNRLLLI